MKKITLIALLLLLPLTLLGSSFKKDLSFKSFTVVLSSKKPLTTGSNKIDLAVYNHDKALSKAKITIKSFMPAMPGMPYMEIKAPALETHSGHYSSEIYFSMSGTWQLHIFITTAEGKKVRLKTSVNL